MAGLVAVVEADHLSKAAGSGQSVPLNLQSSITTPAFTLPGYPTVADEVPAAFKHLPYKSHLKLTIVYRFSL
jgi:hypothetical protein